MATPTVTRRNQSRELGYAEITANQTFTASTFSAKVVGLLLSNLVIPADRTVMVEIYCPVVSHSVATGYVAVELVDDPATTSYGFAKFTSATAAAAGALLVSKRFAPGTCPTALQAYGAASAATGTIFAGTGLTTTVGPAYIRAWSL
jgi:hypothetical protein